MRFGCEAYFYLHSDNLFSYFLEKEAFLFQGTFSRLVPSYSLR